MSETSVLTISAFLFWTLTSLGMVFDKSSWSWPNEFVRAATFLVLYVKFGTWNQFRIPYQILYAVFVASMAISVVMMTARAFNSGAASVAKPSKANRKQE
jgi:hypothetical protein